MDQADSSSGQLQVKAYAKKLDAEQQESVENKKEIRIPVMLSIEAPLSGMAAAERPPVDLVLVLHVQKGRPAPAKWRMLLMEAVEVALGKLGGKDRLAVLADSRTRSVETKSLKSEEELTRRVPSAKYLKEFKLMQVSDENCRQVHLTAVNKAIRSDTSVMTALELANSMLHNREYEDKENRPACVIVISNSDEQDIGSLLAWRFLSVHAFGFRDAHNARTMCAISSSPDCTYALLDDERGRITQAFAACIDRITSASAAMPIEVKLKCERKVALDSIDAPRISYFISYEKNAATIWTSAHQARVSTKFIVYLSLRPEGKENPNHKDWLKFFTVRVKYAHITVHAPESSEKLDNKVVPRSGRMMPPSDMLQGKVVLESDKLHGKVMAESDNLESKTMIESNKPDDKVVDKLDKVDEKVVMESDKIHGKVMAESDNLESKTMIESNKTDDKVVAELDKVDEKVLMESDKIHGKVMAESDNLERKTMMESNKPNDKVVAKLDKVDEKVVMESDKIHGNVMAESGNLERKTMMESNKPDDKVVDELDKVDEKVVMESDKFCGKVMADSSNVESKTMMDSNKPDDKVVAELDKVDEKVVMESDKIHGNVMAESGNLERKTMMESNKPDDKVVDELDKVDEKVVMESDKFCGKVTTKSGNVESKTMMDSNKPDDKVVAELDKVDEKVVMESDKIHGNVMAESGNLERKTMMESNKPDDKVVDELDKVDEKVVMESDKFCGKVTTKSGNVESKTMMDSNKPDDKVVAELDKVDEKVVMESDKIHGNVMAESGNLERKMMMESNKPDDKVVDELDKVDEKVEMESDKTDRKVVMDESKKPDVNEMAQSDKLDGKVVRESNNVDMKVAEESKKLDRKMLAESNKLEGMVVMESEKPMNSEKLDRKVVAESDKKVVPESDKLDRKALVWSSKLDGKELAKPDKLRLKLKVKTIEHDGEVVAVKKGQEEYKEMAGEMVRIEAIKIVADIARVDQKQLHPVDLAEELHKRWSTLENSDCGKEASEAGLISMLAQEMQEMQVRLHYNHFWLEYMLSWQSYQWWQLPLPPLFMDKQATTQSQVDPPLELAIFPKDRATPWATQYTVPQQLKVVVRVAAPGLKRCPVDLIAVLDASYGAEEKRLRLLVKAMELVMAKLDHKDRLAIMHVQSTATEPAAETSLMAMTEQGRDEISTMLKLKFLVVRKPPPPLLAMANEKATQTSHWREQLNKLVRKLLNMTSVNTSIRTVTTPERQNAAVVAQSVICGSNNLWKALEGAKEILVDRPPAEKEQRAGIIIVISDSNDDTIINETPGRSDTDLEYIVHAVSFRDSGTRNTRAMNHIARCFNGIYAVLDDGQEQITDAFTACINKITSIVAVSTVVTIRCNRDSPVVLNNIQSAGQVLHDMDHDRTSVSISAGTFYAGTVRNFIAIMDNVGWYEYGMLYKFFIVDVTWLHPLSRKMDTLHGEVYARDSSEVLKEAESSLIVANTVTVITDPSLDIKLVTDGEASGNDIMIPIEQQLMDKLHRLFHKCSREARDAGEPLLAKEMEKLKDNLEKETVKMHENQRVGKGIDFTFIEELLAEPLPYMLSWLSRNF